MAKKEEREILEHASLTASFDNGLKLKVETPEGKKKPVIELVEGDTVFARGTLRGEEDAQNFVTFFRSLWGDK